MRRGGRSDYSAKAFTESASNDVTASGLDFSALADAAIGGPQQELAVKIAADLVVEVDEEGTEAAAGTAVIMKRGGHPVLRANPPFLFLIRDRTTGVVLLFGRVVDPKAAG